MKKAFLFYISLLLVISSKAQHCPWDCSGMIMIKTNISKEQMNRLSPELADENENEIIDTIYGTGKRTYDAATFMHYDDFLKYRKDRIAIHPWYGYDTAYHFAEGNYLVRYNFCGYDGGKLYIRFFNPNSRGLKYEYIEIPAANRIHLHNYSSMMGKSETEKLKAMLAPKVLVIDCKQWLLSNCE